MKKGVHCGKIIGPVAKEAGGGGGGRPNKAEAGGKQPDKIADALESALASFGQSKSWLPPAVNWAERREPFGVSE